MVVIIIVDCLFLSQYYLRELSWPYLLSLPNGQDTDGSQLPVLLMVEDVEATS